MAINKTGFTIKGMTRDLAVSKFSPELAYENQNLRIIATEENTSYGLVNEKGTSAAGQVVEGIPIGQEIINDSLILFTTSGEGDRAVTLYGIEGGTPTLPTLSGVLNIQNSEFNGDHIYKFKIGQNNSLQKIWEYSGDLGFDSGCPIESIGVFENQQIQKVYWTDGINQPRVINITAGDDASIRNAWNNNSFNFVKVAMYNGSITITKNEISFGSFAPGVIQYCFTYYDLYGPESNIFYTSPLYYVSPSTRGGNPAETVSCSFDIQIPFTAYNNSFDYLRIYSILRTSLDAVPQVRKVVDLAIKGLSSDLHYTDSGIGQESIDPTDLFYIGGEPIFAGTMAQKDNTLFLGDITVGIQPISQTTAMKNAYRSTTITETTKSLSLDNGSSSGNYSYKSQLDKNNSQITYYRRGECYRLGLQAQHYTGRWSEVIFIKDHTVSRAVVISEDNTVATLTNLTASITDTNIINDLISKGYVKVRPVVVFPDANNRNIICEGVCCPTVYNVEDRYTNSPYVQSSWFFRPNGYGSGALSTNDDPSYGKWAEFRHNYPIPANDNKRAEIQCISNTPSLPILQATGAGGTYEESPDEATWVANNRECFFVDQQVFTLHSPDVEFDPGLGTLDSTGNLKFRIVGFVPIHASYSDIDIQATAPSNYGKGKDSDGNYKFRPKVAPGFVKPKVNSVGGGSSYGWRCMLSGAMWFDELPNTINENNDGCYPVGFIVYPWHKTGPLNGASNNSETSILQHKKMSVFRYSRKTVMITPWTASVGSIVKFDSDEVTMVKLHLSDTVSDVTYYGNIDKLINHHNSPKGPRQVPDHDIIGGSNDIGAIAGGAYNIMVASTGTTPDKLNQPGDYSGDTTDIAKERANVRITGSFESAFGASYNYMASLYQITQESSPRVARFIYNDTQTTATDPVSMKYKSTPHLVISLTQSTSTQTILPTHSSDIAPTTSYSHRTFWGSITGVSQSTISLRSALGNIGYLWLGEVYRDDLDSTTRFGGTSDEAIESNSWTAAGEPVSITNGGFTLVWSQGDTYYQRYDCLKTYPFTMDDINSISDTLSFMCETRVNLDGRYDRNRGQLSNLYASPDNINLINLAYSQTNNFFSYRGINTKKVNSTFFPNTVTWSKTKTMGETIDTWTAISLASTLDMDGDKGRVRALRRFNNDILSFQDRAISQILYNESTQITSTAGVPIEIANSGKVSGKRYISNHIGCVNKWSICSAPGGLYFMDDIGKDIFLFDGQLNNISDKFGFHSWVISNFPNIKVWNPRDFATAGEITYYDKVNGDVLFITGNTALAFSEPLGNFSSFYSYGKTPYFGVLADRGILWHTDDSLASGTTNYGKYQAWWHREGDYNYFYNVYKPFSITVVANEHPTEDKIFNNLEYRGDMFDTDGSYLPWNTFNKLETWNEYQNGIANLEDVKDHGYPTSNLKKKFRIWRANIPRNTSNRGGSGTVSYRRDRMRNPWLYIKLSKEVTAPPVPDDPEEPVITEREINNKKSILHDLVVYYYE